MRSPHFLGALARSFLQYRCRNEIFIDSKGGKMIAILAGIGIVAKQVFEWVVTGAIIGALIGGGTGAVIEVATGLHAHGEVNHDVAHNAVNGALEGAKRGAIFGAAAGVVGGTISTAFNLGRSAILAHSFRTLPKTTPPAGYLYVMDDVTSGISKIGITNNPMRRLSELQGLLGKNVTYAGIKRVNNVRAVERALHTQFAGQNVASATGREWFNLSGFDKATVFGW